MRVGWISGDWSVDYRDQNNHPTPGGAGWYRMHLPQRSLAEAGFDTVIGGVPVMTEAGEMGVKDWDGIDHFGCDVIVMQRWMHEIAQTWVRSAQRHGQAVVQDVDDYYAGLSPANASFAGTHPRRGVMNRQQARRAGINHTHPVNRDHYQRVVRASSMVTVSTPFLKQKLDKGDKPVVVIRNCLDLDRWPVYETATRGTKPVVGWVGATTQRSGDLQVLKGVLEPFRAAYDLRLFHGGAMERAPSFASQIGSDERFVSTEPMKTIFDYPTFFTHMDIGVAPLAAVPFNNAKSAIKPMEMAAAGVPFVASPTDEYIWLHDEHGIGRIAKTAKDWRRHLVELLDPDLRTEEAQRQRTAMKALDISDHWQEWARAITIATTCV